MAWIEHNQFLIVFAILLIAVFWPIQSRSFHRIRQRSGDMAATSFVAMYMTCMSFAAFLTEDLALDLIEEFGDSIRSLTTF